MSIQETVFKCTTCSKLFENKTKLKTHEYYKHPKELFTCSTCGKHFKSNGTLQRHILIHTGEQPFACSTCNKRFNQKHRLTEHERIHSGEKPYLCPTCAQRFAYRQTFVEHLRDHAGIKHDCPVCQQEFIYLKHLNKHIKTHADEKHFSCPVCSKEFSELRAFLNHTKDHSGDKQHECQICHKKFKTINVLQKHINDCLKINRIQLCYVAKNKKYRCYSCNKDFLEKDEFDEHVKNHVEERARNRLKANKARYIGKKFVICDICELRCPSKNKMIRHLMTHTGERPIKCSKCCKTFPTNTAVKRHKAEVHGIKIQPQRSYIFHEGRHLLVYNGKNPSKQSISNGGRHQKEVQSHDQPSKQTISNGGRHQKGVQSHDQPSKQSYSNRGRHQKEVQSHDQPSKSSISNESRHQKEVRSRERPSKPSIRNAVRDDAKSHEKVQLHEQQKIDLSLHSFSLGESASLQREGLPFERESSALERESSPLERESSPSERESSLLEREFSPLERESYSLERESSPIGIISLAIPPEKETPETKQHLKKYYFSKVLKLVLHKLTKDEIVKHTSKVQKDYKKNHNVHLHEQEMISLSEKRNFSVKRESSSSESELFLSKIKLISSERKTLDSEKDLNKFDHLINRLRRKASTVVPRKLTKVATKKPTSKRRKRHRKRHKEVLPFPVKTESSLLETESFPSEIATNSPEKEISESEKDLKKNDDLIDKLRRKDLNIVPHKVIKEQNEKHISKEYNGHMKKHKKDHKQEQEKKSLSERNCLSEETQSSLLETESFPSEIETVSSEIETISLEIETISSEIETLSSEKETSELEKDLNKYDHLINKLRRKDLNIVPHKVTKEQTEKNIPKEHNGHMKRHQEVLPFSVKRESSPFETEYFSSEIETFSLDSETQESNKDLDKYDHLISKLRRKDLNIVPHKVRKEQTEKHTTKEHNGDMKRHQKVHLHEQERISLSEMKSLSDEKDSVPLETQSIPLENKTFSPERESPESGNDLNEKNHLINKLRRKDLYIVPLKVTKDSTEKPTSEEYVDESEQNKPESESEEVFSDETKTEEAKNYSGDNSSYLLIVLICFLVVCLLKSLTKKRI